MNPFSWPGGQFLLFYLVVSGVVLGTVLYLRRTIGPEGLPAKRLTEPYIISLLWGGTDQATYLATLHLIRRGLLQCSGRTLKAVDGAEEQVTEPVERAILARCEHANTGHLLLADATIRRAWRERVRELEALGLIADSELRGNHRAIALAGLVVVALVAGTKLVVALNTGHHNVAFLIVLGLIASIVMIVLAVRLPTITPRGRNVMAELQTLFRPLRTHAVSQRGEEALFLAAVFGTPVLSESERNLMNGAFAVPPQQSSSDSGSSGSSCGGGGGGCGGGGCGGCGS